MIQVNFQITDFSKQEKVPIIPPNALIYSTPLWIAINWASFLNRKAPQPKKLV